MSTEMIEYPQGPWIVTTDGPAKALKGVYRNGELSSLLVRMQDASTPVAILVSDITQWSYRP